MKLLSALKPNPGARVSSAYGRVMRKIRIDGDSLKNRNPYLIDALIPGIGWALSKYFRANVAGLERIPKGAALYVGNHNMCTFTMDTGIFYGAVYKARGLDDLPYALAHDFGVTVPFISHLAVMAGAIRASHENAHRVFAKGGKVLVYPGGELDSCRPFRNRNKIVFGGRTGYIRLALSENVPIVPVVTAGAQSVFIIIDDMPYVAKRLPIPRLFRTEVWPLTLSMPLGLTFGPPPLLIPWPSKILMEIMEPISFDRQGPEAAADEPYVRLCADKVETAMQAALSRLARERKQKQSRREAKS
ncbi:MAG: acyltransferase family protein [Deltaproteobacteria bacterium]|nr:acyltransferase family protein [Deltaproteobacteria bacterium]